VELVFRTSRKYSLCGRSRDSLLRVEFLGGERPSLTVPRLIFIDEGIWLQPNSPVWKARTVALVVAVENWKGKPPPKWWSCETHEFDHQELGGVRNGSFKVYVAKSVDLRVDIRTSIRMGVPAKFKHVLDHTIKGARCPIPNTKASPLGQDANGLLHWDRRHHKIAAPSVYSTDCWVRR
jgi:hypothetical protein